MHWTWRAILFNAALMAAGSSSPPRTLFRGGILAPACLQNLVRELRPLKDAKGKRLSGVAKQRLETLRGDPAGRLVINETFHALLRNLQTILTQRADVEQTHPELVRIGAPALLIVGSDTRECLRAACFNGDVTEKTQAAFQQAWGRLSCWAQGEATSLVAAVASPEVFLSPFGAVSVNNLTTPDLLSIQEAFLRLVLYALARKRLTATDASSRALWSSHNPAGINPTWLCSLAGLHVSPTPDADSIQEIIQHDIRRAKIPPGERENVHASLLALLTQTTLFATGGSWAGAADEWRRCLESEGIASGATGASSEGETDEEPLAGEEQED